MRMERRVSNRLNENDFFLYDRFFCTKILVYATIYILDHYHRLKSLPINRSSGLATWNMIVAYPNIYKRQCRNFLENLGV